MADERIRGRTEGEEEGGGAGGRPAALRRQGPSLGGSGAAGTVPPRGAARSSVPGGGVPPGWPPGREVLPARLCHEARPRVSGREALGYFRRSLRQALTPQYARPEPTNRESMEGSGAGTGPTDAHASCESPRSWMPRSNPSPMNRWRSIGVPPLSRARGCARAGETPRLLPAVPLPGVNAKPSQARPDEKGKCRRFRDRDRHTVRPRVVREPEDLDAEKRSQHEQSMAVHRRFPFVSRARRRAPRVGPATTSGGAVSTRCLPARRGQSRGAGSCRARGR